jgi:hypothetical protein
MVPGVWCGASRASGQSRIEVKRYILSKPIGI